MRMKAIAITSGAVLAAALAPGVASADPEHGGRNAPTSAPPPDTPAVTSTELARGSLGEFRVRDRGADVRLSAGQPTDLVLVQATLLPGRETGFHTHAGPSLVIVKEGAMTLVEPRRGNRGCDEEEFGAGDAFPHPSGAHNFVNGGTAPVVFFLAYFVPEDDTPAPDPTDVPRGC
jgi:quercetin dioxygenase-like cupin family protein